jgi:hypothetical protein
MYRFLCLCLLSALIGCQTATTQQADYKRSVNIMFVSFPPGAVIEIDGQYIGRTPNIVALKEYHMDREHYVQYYKVYIYPPQDEGYCTQKLALNPYDLPQRLTFDLTNCNGQETGPFILPNGNLGQHPDSMSL